MQVAFRTVITEIIGGGVSRGDGLLATGNTVLLTAITAAEIAQSGINALIAGQGHVGELITLVNATTVEATKYVSNLIFAYAFESSY